MTTDELEQLVALGHEQRGVEFKPPGPRGDPYLFAKVTRAVLGMANRADGGLVVVGVAEGEDDNPLVVTGLSPGERASWNYDDVTAALAPAADPFVSIDLEFLLCRGVTLLVIRVHEFETVPIICKRQHDDAAGRAVLRQGAVYVRSRRKPETSEIPSQTEMRELLDLAISKGVRHFVALASAAGMAAPLAPRESGDDELFQHELGDFK